MLTLILLLIFGSGVTYLALQNNALVTLTLLTYTLPDVPLFAVILGSILIGVIVAYVLHLPHLISTAFSMHGKDNKIKSSQKDLTQLTKRIHQLELENESLKRDSNQQTDDQSL